MPKFGKRGAAMSASAPVSFAPIAAPLPAARAETPPRQWPLATFAILLLLALVFAMEVHEAGTAPSPRALIALGGIDGNLLFRDYQWWRLFAAPLLHGNPSHIASNAVCLLIIGILLEPLVGRAWFAALFAIGGVGGAFASASYNPGMVVSVGASGAIMGLLAASFTLSVSDEVPEKTRRRLRRVFYWIAIPSLLPALAESASHVDYSAHAGGALAGVMMGLCLRTLWPEGAPRPEFQRLASGVTAAAFVAACVAFLQIGDPASAMAMPSGLMPDDAMPKTGAEGMAQSADLLSRYPKDPRAHYLRALHFMQAENIPNAEDELRIALDTKDRLGDELPDSFEPSVRIMLALTLVAKGQQSEAKAIARPACAYANVQYEGEAALDSLHQAGICI
jgi:rhomboid protease GluP